MKEENCKKCKNKNIAPLKIETNNDELLENYCPYCCEFKIKELATLK